VSEAAIFNEYRPLLFSIAYRMLGSVMDAEDMVQEAFLRWQRTVEAEVQSPKAFLSTVITRLCLDQLRSAHRQRETYVGPWLPEPLVGNAVSLVPEREPLDDTLSMAFLVLLQSLTPVERAVFLLHDVFGYEFGEIARFVGKSEANCRQIARRARQYVAARRPRFDPQPEHHRELMHQFAQAVSTGDLPALLATLADDITLWSDGGGKVAAALNPIYGPANVARFVVSVARKAPPGVVYREIWANSRPGIGMYLNGDPISVLLIDAAEERIQAIHVVVNPDKLRAVPPLDTD
jgi:RNA polymerase sigma-70 factor (ECF subfamily)